jgi:hypothetical protein
MKTFDFVQCIFNGDIDGARNALLSVLREMILVKVDEKKQQIAETLIIGEVHKYPKVIRRVGRLNFIRVRVRHGKIQRNRRTSAVKGYTYRGGHLIRMKPAERLHRRLAARRAKIKRRSKRSQIRRHMLIAMRRRRALGLSYRPFGR